MVHLLGEEAHICTGPPLLGLVTNSSSYNTSSIGPSYSPLNPLEFLIQTETLGMIFQCPLKFEDHRSGLPSEAEGEP